jgi:hypothetical protein
MESKPTVTALIAIVSQAISAVKLQASLLGVIKVGSAAAAENETTTLARESAAESADMGDEAIVIV